MTLGIIMVPEQKKQPHGEESGAASSAESVVSDAVVSTLTGQEFYSGLPPLHSPPRPPNNGAHKSSPHGSPSCRRSRRADWSEDAIYHSIKLHKNTSILHVGHFPFSGFGNEL